MHDIIIDRDGNLKTIYSDDAADLIALVGEATITRASHVEPGNGGWMVDMAPVGGPTFGPFALRADALAAEVAWLQANRGL